jgi:chemotaxis protein MotB
MSRRKKEAEKEPNLERWLVSYADFITLLFAVFVTLYAMGQVDKKKAEAVIRSLRQAFGLTKTLPAVGRPLADQGELRVVPMLSPDGTVMVARHDKLWAQMNQLLLVKGLLEEKLKRKGDESQARVDLTQRGLIVSLQAANFFAPGRATLKKKAYPLLNDIARTLSKYANPVRIEGYTDNTPVHTEDFPSNWELSSERALSVLHFLLDGKYFAPDKISATGYGSTHPIGDNATKAGRKLNRRVDIVMLAPGNDWAEP